MLKSHRYDTGNAQLLDTDFPPLRRSGVKILQVNLGYLCNQSCSHCHVNAGPKRTELMTKGIMDELLGIAERLSIKLLDLTGGAPEMNPYFRYLVESACSLGINVIDRCNLTVLMMPEHDDLAAFLAKHKVTVVASLPCYSEKNVNQQRGKGVFSDSIKALKKLNRLGYGKDPSLPLHLVYNPVGALLPPPQEMLKAEYQQRLQEDFGIVFNDLYTITNMPISRFGAQLRAKDQWSDYLQLLKGAFSDEAFEQVMCRETISVDWQGFLYDCDFNQMLNLPMPHYDVGRKNSAIQSLPSGSSQLIASDQQILDNKLHIRDFERLLLVDRPIAIGEHCYGCTAGQGSSCGGALNAT